MGGLAAGLLHIFALAPRPVRLFMGNRFGDLARLLVSRARTVARKNLEMAFPGLSAKQRHQMLRTHFRSLGQGLVELGPLWFWPLDQALSLIREVRGAEAVDAALAGGQGVILFTAHLGAWEAVVQYIGQRWPVTVMYMATRNASINTLMTTGRGRSGARLVPKEKGIRPLLEALQKGEVAGILPDQNVDPREGVFAPFFHRPACTTPLLARLARRRQSPVFGIYAYRLPKGRGYRVEIVPMEPGFPAGDDEADAAAMNAALETAILKAPEQYWWIHRRYKDPAPGWEYPY